MNFLNTHIARKLNVLGLLLSLKYMPSTLFAQNLQHIAKECFPEIHHYLETFDQQRQ